MGDGLLTPGVRVLSALATTEPRPGLFMVRLERGGPWDWSRGPGEQDGWLEHARFMDELVHAGFILSGGPLEGDRATLHVAHARSEEEVRANLAKDPWAANGMLRVKSIERWTILDGHPT